MSTRTSTATLRTGDRDGSLVRRSVLPGGLRVLTESVPGVRSVTVGVWVAAGSRDESAGLAGASHYLEHLLFKGTPRRSALQISSELDAVGGELNAFTTKEYTCYYARVLDRDLPLAVDVLGDMVTRSLLAAADVESERGVVLEEIAMHDDDPADGVHDAFGEALFGAAPLGRPVLGSTGSITALSRSALAGYYRRRYRAPATVVALSGRVEHAAALRLVRRAFGRWLDLGGADGAAADRVGVGSDAVPVVLAGTRRPRPARRPRPVSTVVWDRPTEQANLVLGCAALARTDNRRYALDVLNAALGGGMSSRLFQEVRERRGLAYSVYSFTSYFADTGLFGVSVGCQPARGTEVVELCRSEIERVVRDGLTPDELARGQGQLRGALLLGLEDTGARMTRLAKGELLYGEVLGADEIVRRIERTSLDDVAQVAADVLTQPLALAAVGPVTRAELAKAVA